MKNITLLGINARFTHSNLALLYIRESIIDLDYKTVILEENINQDKFKILSSILESEPDILAISVYIWNRDLVKFIVSSIKRLYPEIKVVLGGPEAGYNHPYWLSLADAPDYIIVGGGEAGWRHLCLNKFDLQEKVIQLKNKPFSQIPLPYHKADFANLENRYIYYESSRGCPFNCSFCISSRMDQQLEFKSFEQIKEELDFMLVSESNIIKFVDRSFNADRKVSRAVWSYINSLETKTKFHFEVHPGLLSEEDFTIFQETPQERIQLEIGIQSTNEQTLREIHRTHQFGAFKDNLQKLLTFKNIHTHLDLIIGLPYEDKASFLNSLNDLLLLEPDVIQLGFLKVLPGTEMHEKTEEYELIYDVDPPYQVLQTKWVSFADMKYFYILEDTFDLIFNASRFTHTLKLLRSYYSRPVDLFISFVGFLGSEESLDKKNWQAIFSTFRRFLLSDLPQLEKAVLDDYLSWDWLTFTRKDNLPAFLQREEIVVFRKAVFSDLRSDKFQFWENLLGAKVKALTICAFYVASTEQFSQDILDNDKQALIFKDEIFTIDV